MEEPICNIEIVRRNDGQYVSRVESAIGGSREMVGESIDILLDRIFEEIRDEVEASNI